MGNCLATIHVVWKLGLLCLFPWRGELCSHLTQYNMSWVKAYRHTKWHLDSSSHLVTSDMGQKLGAVPLLGELGPHLTQCAILIYATVWPQYTNVTDRTGQTMVW